MPEGWLKRLLLFRIHDGVWFTFDHPYTQPRTERDVTPRPEALPPPTSPDGKP